MTIPGPVVRKFFPQVIAFSTLVIKSMIVRLSHLAYHLLLFLKQLY
jgi:hypothetical protein